MGLVGALASVAVVAGRSLAVPRTSCEHPWVSAGWLCVVHACKCCLGLCRCGVESVGPCLLLLRRKQRPALQAGTVTSKRRHAG